MLSDQEIVDHVRTIVEAMPRSQDMASQEIASQEAFAALAANLLRNINDIAEALRGVSHAANTIADDLT